MTTTRTKSALLMIKARECIARDQWEQAAVILADVNAEELDRRLTEIIKIWQKACRLHRFFFLRGKDRIVYPICIYDYGRNKMLFEERGLYKRLGSGKLSPPGGKEVFEDTIDILEQETGIAVQPEQIRQSPVRSSLSWYQVDCYAITASEFEALKKIATRFQSKWITTSLCTNRWALSFIAEDSVRNIGTYQDFLMELQAIENELPCPLIFPVYEKRVFRPYIVELEKEQNLEIQTDQYRWIFTQKVMTDFMSPERETYSVDMTHFLMRKDFWTDLGISRPETIGQEDPLMEDVYVAGGKGSNLKKLISLSASRSHPRFKVPSTLVITTLAFEAMIIDTGIENALRDLDACSELEEQFAKAKEIQEVIKKKPRISEATRRQIDVFVKTCGDRRFAVRSSATDEDQQAEGNTTAAAAGFANSYLHVRGTDAIIEKVREVFASNFNCGFIFKRFTSGELNRTARMAVVIQPMVIDANVVGVVLSSDMLNRPGYHIEAAKGCGEMVVAGKHPVDRILVDPKCKTILEHKASNESLVLQNDEILTVAETSRTIRDYYKKASLANEIDVEFCLSHKGLHILQARAEEDEKSRTIKGKPVYSVVDEAAASRFPSVPVKGLLASKGTGASHGRLNVIEKPDPRKAAVNDIIIVEHTNNSWNAVFPYLAGIICKAGGGNSHAAKNARSLHIPTIVGANISHVDYKKLEQWSGSSVTLDILSGRIYKGTVPLIKHSQQQSLWVNSECNSNDAENKEHAEYTCPSDANWKEAMRRRPNVFLPFPDNRWRRRSFERISPCQIGFYINGWRNLVHMLNNEFTGRKPFTLTLPRLTLRNTSGEIGSEAGLFTAYAPAWKHQNIYQFLTNMKDFEIKDLWNLLSNKLSTLQETKTYLDNIDVLSSTNIEEVFNKLSIAMSYMHLSAFIYSSGYTTFCKHHLEALNPEITPFLQRAVIFDSKYLRNDLSRNRDLQCIALREIIKNEQTSRNFLSNPTERIIESLPNYFNAFGTSLMQSMPLEYKVFSEDLRSRPENDIAHYIRMIREGLNDASGETSRIEAILAVVDHFTEELLIDYLSKNGVLANYEEFSAVLNKRENEILKLAVKYYTRVSRTSPEQLFDRNIEKVQRLHETKQTISNYPNLAEALKFASFETALREDGHHMIVAIQRRLLRLLTRARADGLFKAIDDDLFNYLPEELVFLSGRTNMVQTIKEAALLRNAIVRVERKMREAWHDKTSCVEEYFDEYQRLIKENSKIINKSLAFLKPALTETYLIMNNIFMSDLHGYTAAKTKKVKKTA